MSNPEPRSGFRATRSRLHPMVLPPILAAALLPGLAIIPLTACSNHEMYDQPRYDPLETGLAFPDSQSARVPPKGTVTRGDVSTRQWLWPREPWSPSDPLPVAAATTDTFPKPVTREMLARGRERFGIYCTPCHGAYGYGDGMVTRHGFPNPPSYHIPRLLAAPDGHFYDVITHGFGRMYPYAYRVAPPDRWAIIAYIRALQLSRHAALSDLPPEERRRLESL